ncbi:hypothetical protein B9Z65_2148 [Elsinoe australis]|uniref:Carbohydrate-binding module family 19 domain-containing protein n=1 Tax=Elsinoe australis TaxID=40998 RepID=A0A2P7YN67_9PEZI|nr:hypothetical protein B9Z65_2148 [Elsinoe australis]
MYTLTTSSFLALAALSSISSAHLILTEPTPFVFQKPDYKRDPLNPDGSDYPCKKVNGQPLQSQGNNDIAVGQTYNLKWDNYVTHGGGSCQLSVTRDLDPTSSSKFKVIKTWQGGCPIASDGNNWAAPLPWEMPEEVQDGEAVLAWTWMPRLGIREEIYMNCAPINVSGGASDDSAFNSLPDLFLPNLQSSSCHKPLNSENLVVPNPGKYAVTGGDQYGFVEGTGNGCAAGSNPPPSGGYGGGSAPAPSAPAPAPSPPTPSSSSSSAQSEPTGYTPPATDGGLDLGANRGYSAGDQTTTTTTDGPVAPTPAPVESPPAPPVAQAPAPGSTGEQSGDSSSVSSGSSAPAPADAANMTCTADGQIVCNGEKQFALCNFGKIESWLQAADGTVCRDGKIQESDDYVGKTPSRARRHRRHLAMHKASRPRSM